MSDSPFHVGEHVHPRQLLTWDFAGFVGRPGPDERAVRQFKKGHWILEVNTHESLAVVSEVISIRVLEDDDTSWSETRQRLLRHKRC